MFRKKEADEIYALGIARKAQPLDHLKGRYQDFQKRMMTNASAPVVEDATPARPSGQAPRQALAPTSKKTTSSSRMGSSSRIPTVAAMPSPPVVPSSNSRLQIFVDPTGEESAAASNSGWAELGTRKTRVKENVPETKKLAGTTIKQAGKAARIASSSSGSSSKIVPYRDPNDQPSPPATTTTSSAARAPSSSKAPVKPAFAPFVDTPEEKPAVPSVPAVPAPAAKFTPFRDEVRVLFCILGESMAKLRGSRRMKSRRKLQRFRSETL